MERSEFIFLGLCTVLLIALVIAEYAREDADAKSPDPVLPPSPLASKGRAYLMYNQPWGFGPPVQNIVPKINALPVASPDCFPAPTAPALVMGD